MLNLSGLLELPKSELYLYKKLGSCHVLYAHAASTASVGSTRGEGATDIFRKMSVFYKSVPIN